MYMAVVVEREVLAAVMRSRAVDWARFADGKYHVLTRGEDFEQRPDQAHSAFLSWASRNRLTTHAGVMNSTQIFVWAQPRPGTREDRNR